jgi:alkaline phosphatase
MIRNPMKRLALDSATFLVLLTLLFPVASCGVQGEDPGSSPQIDRQPEDERTVREDRHQRKIPATDSAAAATAMATGRKTHARIVSWDENGHGSELLNLGDILSRRSWSVGVVSTVPFSHATPACFVSHDPDRNHFFEGSAGNMEPGISEEIITSGVATLVIGAGNPLWDNPDWRETSGFISRGVYERLVRGDTEFAFVERRKDVDGAEALAELMDGLDPDDGARVMGLFGGADGCFEPPVPTGDGTAEVLPATEENPTLAEASGIALDFLSRDREGFFLMIEQGDIDWANHHNDYLWMIGAMWDLEGAARTVVNYVDTSSILDWDNTLVILTADHSNSFMRLTGDPVLGLGELPAMIGVDPVYAYPGGEVVYGCLQHTNELVSFHGRFPDRVMPLVASLEGQPPAPGGRLLDNTHIFQLVTGAADLELPVTHVILIIGDGMNLAHEIAASRYLYGTDDGMAWQDEQLFPYSNWCTTWDIDTYDRYAAAAGVEPYSPDSFDPTIGYDPERGGFEPLQGERDYFLGLL